MKGDQPEEKGGHHHIYQKPKRGHLTESGNRRLHREKLRGTGILGFFKKDDD